MGDANDIGCKIDCVQDGGLRFGVVLKSWAAATSLRI